MTIKSLIRLSLVLLLGLTFHLGQAQVTGNTFNGQEIVRIFYNGGPGFPALLKRQSNPTNPIYANDVTITLKNTTSSSVYYYANIFYDRNGNGIDIADYLNSGAIPIAPYGTKTITVSIDISSGAVANQPVYVGFNTAISTNPGQQLGGQVSPTIIYDPPSNLQQALTVSTVIANKPESDCTPIIIETGCPGDPLDGITQIVFEDPFAVEDYIGNYTLRMKIWDVDPLTSTMNEVDESNHLDPLHAIQSTTTDPIFVLRDASFIVDDVDIKEYQISHYATYFDGTNDVGIWIEDGDNPGPLAPLIFLGVIDVCEGEPTTVEVDCPGGGGGSGGTGRLAFTPATTPLDLLASPNPTANQTELQFFVEEAGDIAYTLLNVNGQTVLPRQTQRVKAGEQSLTVSLAHLPAGIYFCRLENATGIQHVRIVKLNP